MKNILVIHSSPRGKDSLSRKLADAVLERLEAQTPGVQVKTTDLALDPAKHFDGSHLSAFFTPAENHTEADKESIRYSNDAVADVMKAEIIVISLPFTGSTPQSTVVYGGDGKA